MEQENFINLVKKIHNKSFFVMWKWSNVAFNEFDFFVMLSLQMDCATLG